ncbi:hypothetical protein NPIL_231272 [Nephila pilipes]|uniref:Cyclic nucleotide-binding domain-containing protein n=1 Tax=Nephila pilipes TaxID=299642 RepID=A0A8X6IZ76_NEPPI|nr:hypothetical protein NPIL_231272 [Nephila pilipes]
MGNAIACATEIRQKSIRICKTDWRYKKADWIWLLQKTKLHDPYKGGLYGDDPAMSSLFIPYGTCDECMVSLMPYIPSDRERKDLDEAARKKVLRAMKGFLWRQFRNGLIQRRALKFLSKEADNACDSSNKYLRAKELSSKFTKSRSLYRWLVKNISNPLEKIKLQESSYEREIQQLKFKHRRVLGKFCSKCYFSWWFEPLIMIVIVFNIAQIIIDGFMVRYLKMMEYSILVNILSIVFMVFYVSEIVMKVLVLGWHYYIMNPWNTFHFAVSVIAVIGGTVDYILIYYYPLSLSFFLYSRLLIVLRLVEIYRILRMFLFYFLSLLREYYSEELYYEYDVGRGFLFANQDVLQKIEAIVDFGPCVQIPLTICEENIIQVLFQMTKEVVYAPRVRPVIHDVSKILEESDWIRFADASKIILENHIICSYRRGEIIQEVGKPHQYVYVIVSGIVKVLWNNAESKTSPDQTYNKLPNTDTFLFFKLNGENEIWDFLITSQTLGLLGYLQKTKSVTTAVCEKDCELLQINYAFLKSAEEEYKINYAMWRMVAINVGVSILKKQPRYMDYNDDDIKMLLQKGILPSLHEMVNWKVPSVIDDMVLIQGRVKDSQNALKFIGPAYIPNTCKNLIVLGNIDKRPQVVMILLPIEEYNFKLCRHWTNPAEISSSGLCTLHCAGVQIL